MLDSAAGPPTALAGAAPSRGHPNPYVSLAIVLAAVFVQLLDISIVNVAVPSIQRNLHASYSAVQLVLAGYQLGFATMLITGARLGDIYGRKRLFIIGMLLFTVSSAACGAAPNAMFLVIARVLQGLASGLMFPQVLSVIQVAFPARDRGKAFGIYGATIGLATILGPLVGGSLIALNIAGLSWRLIFYVNLPIGAAAVIAAIRELQESRAASAPGLDIPGVFLSAGGLFLLVYPLTTGREQGWPLGSFLLLAASVPVLAAFGALEVSKTRRNASPLVNTSLFGDRAFRIGGLLSLVFFMGIPPFFFTFSLYLQIGQGFSALGAGLTTFPFAVGSALAASRSDKIAKRVGNRVLLIGCALLVAGQVLTIVVARLAGVHVHAYDYSAVFLIAGLGLGLFIAPVTTVILSEVRRELAGAASGALSTLQQVGGAIGVAAIGIIFFGLLGTNAQTSAVSAVPALRSALSAAHLTGAPAQATVATFVACYDKRAHARDPTGPVAGCATMTGNAQDPVNAAFRSAAVTANKRDFAHSIAETLIFEVLIFAAAFVLVLRLPKVAPTSAETVGAHTPA